jgi:DNA-binding NarL/FixJ family response regulator
VAEVSRPRARCLPVMELASAPSDAHPALLVAGPPGALRARAEATLAGTVEASGVLVLASEGTAAERVAAIEALTQEHEGRAVVALMPTDATRTELLKALRAGAAGIVLDGALDHALPAAVAAAAAGHLCIPAALGRRIAARPLSHREKEILGLAIRGLTNREIAARLYVAPSTVKTHLSSAFEKLDARSRAEAAALVLDSDNGHGMGILGLVDAQADGA